MSQPSLLVASLVYGGVEPDTVASLLRLGGARPCNFRFLETADLAHGRNLIVKEMGDVELLLFVDSDMVFHPSHVQLLEDALQENPKRGAVCGFYIKRDGTGLPVCSWRDGEKWMGSEDQAKKAGVLRGVNRVDSFGAGLLLISKKALDAVGFPWFRSGYEGEEFYSEDTGFCQNLIRAGYEPSVHFDCRIGHRGGVTWHPEHFYPRAEAS